MTAEYSAHDRARPSPESPKGTGTERRRQEMQRIPPVYDNARHIATQRLRGVDWSVIAKEVGRSIGSCQAVHRKFLNQKYTLAQFVTDCDKDDRSIDRNTNTQRFDLTPPKDLPPPPRN